METNVNIVKCYNIVDETNSLDFILNLDNHRTLRTQINYVQL